MSLPERSPSALPRARFLLITGKGGVGKSTVSAALARAYEAEGKRVLLAMCNAKDRVSAMLGSAKATHEVQRVSAHIDLVNIDPDRAIEEYGLLTLRSRTLYKLLFDNRYVRSFLRAVPGLQDWSMLGKAWWHTTELNEENQFKYDVVLLDAPATGHGLDMLRVPKVIVDVVPPGLLRRDAERAWQLFQDPTQAGVVLVTLAEEMPVTESLELLASIRDELSLPVAEVIVNNVLPALFHDAEAAQLQRAAGALQATSPEAAVLRAGALRAQREQLQREAIERLRTGAPKSPKLLPAVLHGAEGPRGVRALTEHLRALQ